MNAQPQRKAFSLIEILVVVALIGILSTLLVIAVGKLRNNSRRQQTQLTFQNLQAIFSDFDTVTHYSYGKGTVNFTGMAASEQTNMLKYIYLPAPGNVTSSGSDNQGVVVQSTRDFMAMFLQNPASATAVGKLPASSLMTFHGTNLGSPPLWSTSTTYQVYQVVSFVDSTSTTGYFRRIQVYADTSGTTNPYGYLLPDSGSQSPPDPTY